MFQLKATCVISSMLIIVASCQINNEDTFKENEKFNPSELKNDIKLLGLSWSKGLKSKDISIFENLYDEDAHYFPDGENAIRGNKNISEFWNESMQFLTDIQLNMETLEGTRSLLYETGNGKAMFLNQEGGTDTLNYKYVNVWKLQSDGSYKVVIDVYNDIKN